MRKTARVLSMAFGLGAFGCADMSSSVNKMMASAGTALSSIKVQPSASTTSSSSTSSSSTTTASGPMGSSTQSTEASASQSTQLSTGPAAAPAPAAPVEPAPVAPAADASAAPAPQAAPAETPDDPEAPLSATRFSELLKKMKGYRSGGREVTVDADSQLKLVQEYTQKGKFTCKQLKSVIKAFDFQEDKLRALKIIKPVLADDDGLEDVPKLFDEGGYEQKQAQALLK